MFVHPIIPHQRRDGRKPSSRQQAVGALVAMLATGITAAIGAGFSHKAHHDLTVLAFVVVGLGFVIGFVLARIIGGQSRA